MFNFFKKKPAYFQADQMISTECGMWGIWDYQTYQFIESYDEWDPEFCEDEDILRQIKAQTFVPIYLGSDGCCKFRLKADGELEEHERACILGESQEYLFRTQGDIALSGIENIGENFEDEDGILIEAEPGLYSVKVYIIDWEKDPESVGPDGEPTEGSLPDFIVMLNSEPDEGKTYYEGLETFKK